ncbi:MAG TPA: CHRD domain-containing protein [Gemmatales bacterium]|nr:CHRD domain-containing protein [Gemmatales bacterium]HMP58999.1 CHRD domain-containing protein [Gemmatales bacterium]
MILKIRHWLGLVVLGCLICPGSAWGQTHTFSVFLDGLQEVPPNASPGFGFADGTYDTGTNLLTWTITYSGLLAPANAAHFHIAPVGVNGPVVIDIPSNSGGNILSPIVGSATVLAADEASLLAGDWYINIHTSVFPGGEIRGQVELTAVPEPATLALVGAGTLGLVAFVQRKRRSRRRR